MLSFLADHIHRITGDLSEEVMKPKPKHGARVVRGDSWGEVLILVIDADYDGNSVPAKVQVGFHEREPQGMETARDRRSGIKIDRLAMNWHQVFLIAPRL